MQFEIKSRWDGIAVYTADIEATADTPRSVALGLAVRAAVAAEAVLRGANLSGANLSGASLSRAILSGADLSGAIGLSYQIPQEGELIVYKKTTTGVTKLRIPPEAKRTASIVGRKCRAEFAEVIEAPSGARSLHDRATAYVAGTIVRPDAYNEDPRVECTNGIHFFLSREEAEAYQ